jgi:hypothetical protein
MCYITISLLSVEELYPEVFGIYYYPIKYGIRDLIFINN